MFSCAMIVLSRMRCPRDMVLSHALFSQYYRSLSHALSCAIIVLSCTRYSCAIIILSFVRAMVLSLSYARRYHSLTFASSFSLCIILQCVVLVPRCRHPCRTLMPSLSHCPLHILSAILFPHIALAFSHLHTVFLFSSRTPRPSIALRFPLPRAWRHSPRAAIPSSPRVTTLHRAAVPLAPHPPWEDLS